jgi:hypothetical protein
MTDVPEREPRGHVFGGRSRRLLRFCIAPPDRRLRGVLEQMSGSDVNSESKSNSGRSPREVRSRSPLKSCPESEVEMRCIVLIAGLAPVA